RSRRRLPPPLRFRFQSRRDRGVPSARRDRRGAAGSPLPQTPIRPQTPNRAGSCREDHRARRRPSSQNENRACPARRQLRRRCLPTGPAGSAPASIRLAVSPDAAGPPPASAYAPRAPPLPRPAAAKVTAAPVAPARPGCGRTLHLRIQLRARLQTRLPIRLPIRLPVQLPIHIRTLPVLLRRRP